MLKVVIADDEPRICQLVQVLADWNSLGMEVVGVAANGIEALEIVAKHCPDILITDIRMPGCDGLELIERVRKVCPNLEIMIISGHAHFEYAQSAMRFGVGDYLLKPIKKDALMATLEKLAERCRARNRSQETIAHLRSRNQQSGAMLKRKLVEDLVHQHLAAPTAAMMEGEYRFRSQGGLLQFFILKLDYDAERFGAGSLQIVQEKALEVFEPAVATLCTDSVFAFLDSAGYALLSYPQDERDTVRRTMRNALNQLEAQKYFFGTVEFTLAQGRAVADAGELPLSLGDARRAAAERLIEGTGRLLDAPDSAASLRIQYLLEQYARTIGPAVETFSEEQAARAVDELCQATEQEECVQGWELLDVVEKAYRLFCMQLQPEDEAAVIAFQRRCTMCNKADQLFTALKEVQAERIRATAARRTEEQIRPIRIAKQFVQQHYGAPIALEDVCAEIGFSVSYFSSLFKKETGEGFHKYLTRVRMEQAKSFLQTSDYSVADICTRVGYSDLKHFTATFKKTTGLSPSQFRKLYG